MKGVWGLDLCCFIARNLIYLISEEGCIDTLRIFFQWGWSRLSYQTVKRKYILYVLLNITLNRRAVDKSRAESRRGLADR